MQSVAAKQVAVIDAPGTEAWSKKVRRRARNLVEIIDRGYWDLAEIIYQVWNTPVDGDPNKAGVYVSWGYTSYTDWATKELGLDKRQTYRLKGIWQKVEVDLKGKIPPEIKQRLRNLGMAHIRELVRVISERNVAEWVALAENLTHEELLSAIKQALKQTKEDHDRDKLGIDPPEEIESYKWTGFQLDPEQRANVKLALAKAEQLTGTSRMAVNLDMICTDFVATNDHGLATDPNKALRYLAKFERLTGRKLIVVDPRDWQIEYGLETLENMAGTVDDE